MKKMFSRFLKQFRFTLTKSFAGKRVEPRAFPSLILLVKPGIAIITFACVFCLFPAGPARGEDNGAAAKIFSENAGGFNIRACYPVTESSSVNGMIRGYILRAISDFKRENPGGGSLSIGFEKFSYGESSAGFAFESFAEAAGKPGSRGVSAFQFDLIKGRRLGLEDAVLINRESAGLLKSLCRAGLEAGGAPRAGAEAALEKEDAFSNFVFDEHRLSFYFGIGGTVCRADVGIGELGWLWRADEYFENVFVKYYAAPEPDPGKKDETFPVSGDEAGEEDFTMGEIENFLFEFPLFTKREEGKKYIALTFDDGPNALTSPLLLDILKETGAKATFFVLGHRAGALRDITKRIYDEGHELGNHSFNHDLLSALPPAEIQRQMDRANEVIMEIIGKPVKLMRPPYGAMNKNVKNAARDRNMSIILWDIDPRDWKTGTGTDSVVNRVVSKAGDGSIILMHDQTLSSAEAARRIITELKDQGYEFLTVSDLLHMNAGFECGAVYGSAREANRE